MINTQNREDCKAFFDKLDLKKIAHLCKCQNDNPPTKEKLDINEKRTERKKKRKMQKENKKMAKQYKICEKLLEKAYYRYNNIKDFEFVLGGAFPYIKVTFHDNRFNEVVTILIFD